MKKVWIVTAMVVILQLGSIYTMAFNKLAVRKYGVPVKVSVEPIDPRSLFRGDYVILRYPFSSLRCDEIGLKKHEMHELKNVYVILKKKGDLWEYDRASVSKPPIAQNEVFLKGVVVSDMWDFSGNGSVSVKYGIESYFVPEGEGKELEKHREKRNLSAEIYVNSRGTALLTGLFAKGERVSFEK
ncbi:MAG: GDYXXLXY domain-containing protein [bacterium]|nr:GDYXXLXY domain-containing protein [bacterium]